MVKRTHWKWYLPYAIVIVFLVIASFYDYAIDDALYNPQNIFGLFFERIALFPLEMLIPIGFMALFKIHHRWFYGFAYIISCSYVLADAAHFWFSLQSIYLPLTIGIVIFMALLALLLQNVPMSFWTKYEKFFIFIIVVILSSMLLTTILKQPWGRVRYREMLEEVSLFSNWFQPQGINGHNSFPSGHVTMMSSVLCFLEIHRSCGIQKRVSLVTHIILVLLIILMMFARILVGAHFLSDVSIGFTITYTMYLYWRKRLFREDFI